MNNLDKKYQQLLSDIIEFGVQKKDRTGTGTISEFGHQIRHKMSEGFPLLTTKKMAWKTMVTELLWFLRGDTNIKFLVDNGCHIWDGDAYKNFVNRFEWKSNGTKLVPNGKLGELNENGELLTQEQFIHKIKTDNEFAQKWGELGKIYGKQWRNWEGETEYLKHKGVIIGENTKIIDQIANLINELKTNPDSRRMLVSAWNVGELDAMVLPPCHYGFQMYTRELSFDERVAWWNKDVEDGNYRSLIYDKEELDENNVPTRAISLMYNTRSQDVPLGTPFNIASYALLLMMIAKQVNMVPDELIANMGDCHVYLNQIDGVKEQLTRTPYELPTVKISDKQVNDISEYEIEDFILENYQSHPSIKLPLSN